MEIDEIIKELDEKLRITKKEAIEKTIYIYCQKERQASKCRYCGVESSKIHSKYTRELLDLPIAQYKVKYGYPIGS